MVIDESTKILLDAVRVDNRCKCSCMLQDVDFLLAARTGDVEKLGRSMKENEVTPIPVVRYGPESGATGLMLAAGCGHAACVELLAKKEQRRQDA